GGFAVPAAVRALCVGCGAMPGQRTLDLFPTGAVLAGGGALLGTFSTFFLTDDKMTTGTSYLLMAGPPHWCVEGFAIASSANTSLENTLWWVLGGSAVGLTATALLAGPVDPTIGDSLVLHTGAFWGTLTGFMLWGSIGAEREADLGKFLLAGL